MSDLISRQDAVDALKKYQDSITETFPISILSVATIANCIEEIVKLPSAEPEKTAKVENIWTEYAPPKPYSYFIKFGFCGNCGETVKQEDKYCHRCGLKLEWGKDE